MSQCAVGRWALGTPAHRAESRAMSLSRLLGLALPMIFLVALSVGLAWYWRESRRERQRRSDGD